MLQCVQAQANNSWGRNAKVHQLPLDVEQPRRSSGQFMRLQQAAQSCMSITSTCPDVMPQSQQIAVLRMWLLNHWLRELMSDTSPVSYFSRGSHAQFFGNLVHDNPFVIDYLLSLPPDKLEPARVSCLTMLIRSSPPRN